MSHVLNPLTFALHGSRLIEASAGTGKTWTIAALYLRLVLGHGQETSDHADASGVRRHTAHPQALMPPQILVMTFTRAATQELSERIRQRLVEAVRCFRGEQEPAAHDELLRALLADYPEGPARQQAAWRLVMAAESMDDAAVHTIDAWCQRMLREHAFDSGNLFNEELQADEELLRREAAQDYWRQQLYPLSSQDLEVALSVWPRMDTLDDDVRNLLAQELPPDAGEGELAEVIVRVQQERSAALTALAQGWLARADSLQQWIEDQLATQKKAWDGRKLSGSRVAGWLEQLREWARDPVHSTLEWTSAARHRLSPAGMLEARKPDAQAFELPADFVALAALHDALDGLPSLAASLRLHAAARVAQRLLLLKRQAGTFGFADMLDRMEAALLGPNAATLRARILAQYPVALIDEFQDTSPQQYRLFDLLYRTASNDASTALLLIGDPKQSIYGFRGADIYSYLQAREATLGRHYVLGTNYRSTAALVGAINHWFGQAEARPGEGAFLFRDADGASENPLPFVPVAAQGRKEQFVTAHGAVPALNVQFDGAEVLPKEVSMRWFAARCAEQVVQWLNDGHTGFQAADHFTRLRPADIAILVRTGKEAAAVRRELRRRHVASVYLSDRESVLQTEEAHDLVFWLRAVASPLDMRSVRAGLATRLMGWPLEALAHLAQDDEALDERSEQLKRLHKQWQNQGVLAMLRQTLHLFDLPARWLAETGGERRLTNYLHLAEMLQNASAELEGEQALIRWLETQRSLASSGSEEQIVRLESDADLVKVVTVHKSKGLEYPVVCLPFASSFRAVSRRMTSFVSLAQKDGTRSLHLDVSDADLSAADQERLREDLRLLYVAMTRPRHALWMGLGLLREGRSNLPVNHRSAAGYVLAGPEEREPQAWQEALENLCASAPLFAGAPAVYWQAALPAPLACTLLNRQETLASLLDAPIYTADFDRHWGIGSFSSLTRAMAQAATSVAAVQLPRPADDELPMALEDGQEVLADDVVEMSTDAPATPSVWHRFMRGAVVGNFVHDQLEWLAGEGFALEADGQGPVAERLRQRCARAGRTAQADDLLLWLTQVVHQPLGVLGQSLAGLENILPEMEFWLPAHRLPAPEIDRLCRLHILPGLDRPILPERFLHGMLMGFADLVLEQDGRFWVLDYKSNHLGDNGAAYDQATLAGAMLHHRYDVQAAIYLLALHRLLRSRLGAAYNPAQQLGGALYFFLRGIDGPQQGLLTLNAPLALLDALDALLSEPEAAL